jgi:hypothetical protein
MVDLELGDALSFAQTVGIIVTLVLTLYFSRKQIRTMAIDIETRVLNDLDEKQHRLIEMSVNSPQLIRTMWDVGSKIDPELPISYYVMYIGAHVYHMRQRKILSDNEWAGCSGSRIHFNMGPLGNIGKMRKWSHGLTLPFETL